MQRDKAAGLSRYGAPAPLVKSDDDENWGVLPE
jgi:hypothetical protein